MDVERKSRCSMGETGEKVDRPDMASECIVWLRDKGVVLMVERDEV